MGADRAAGRERAEPLRTSVTDEADAMGELGWSGDEDGSMLEAAGDTVAGDRPAEVDDDSAETMYEACGSHRIGQQLVRHAVEHVKGWLL